MIWFFYLLLVKHAIADLWLQGRLNKPKFGSKDNLLTPKLWLHCLDHAVLTLIIALLFVGLLPALMFAVLDFVTHLIIDYAKNRYVSHTKLTTKNHKFWKIQSVDQILHYTTYFVIVILVIN